MGQVGTDAKGPRARPLSPHLQVWRWHITMAASILTRASGVALYVGLLIVVVGALALASGPDAYDLYTTVMGSILGKLVLFGLTVAIFYHLAAGLRHLAFDSGKGFAPATANASAAFCIAFSIVAALAAWGAYFATGGV